MRLETSVSDVSVHIRLDGSRPYVLEHYLSLSETEVAVVEVLLGAGVPPHIKGA